MKREIKFRAWARIGEWDEKEDKRQFEMIDGDSLCPMEFEPFKDSLRDIEDEYYIMQFTGLKDKNGKEIYEGDIYKIGDKNTGVWIVVYHKCAFKMIERSQLNEGEKCPQTDFPLVTYFSGEHIEIIGNIYENPELLIEDKIKDPEYYPLTLLININDKCPLE